MNYQAIRAKAHESHKKRQAMHRKDGGAIADVHAHESHLHRGEPKTKLRDGGKVEGRARGGRTDRPGKSGKTVVNIVMPQGGGDKPVPVPVPVRPPMGAAPGGPPPGAMPPRPMPPGPPPGGVSGMGAMPPPGAGAPPMMPPRAKGGRMTAGAASGEGRLEKAEGRRGFVA